MSSRLQYLKGDFTVKQFNTLMLQFNFETKTKRALRKVLVKGEPYSKINGTSRQFIYKKLVAIDKKLNSEKKEK